MNSDKSFRRSSQTTAGPLSADRSYPIRQSYKDHGIEISKILRVPGLQFLLGHKLGVRADVSIPKSVCGPSLLYGCEAHATPVVLIALTSPIARIRFWPAARRAVNRAQTLREVSVFRFMVVMLLNPAHVYRSGFTCEFAISSSRHSRE